MFSEINTNIQSSPVSWERSEKQRSITYTNPDRTSSLKRFKITITPKERIVLCGKISKLYQIMEADLDKKYTNLIPRGPIVDAGTQIWVCLDDNCIANLDERNRLLQKIYHIVLKKFPTCPDFVSFVADDVMYLKNKNGCPLDSVKILGSNAIEAQLSRLEMSEEKQEKAPFTSGWLAEHFRFKSTDIKRIDSIDDMTFEVYFKSDKKDVAALFYDNLSANGCNVGRIQCLNVVFLYQSDKEKILSAGLKVMQSPQINPEEAKKGEWTKAPSNSAGRGFNEYSSVTQYGASSGVVYEKKSASKGMVDYVSVTKRQVYYPKEDRVVIVEELLVRSGFKTLLCKQDPYNIKVELRKFVLQGLLDQEFVDKFSAY